MCDAIKNFTTIMKPVIDSIKFVGDVFSGMEKVVHEVEHLIAPLKWVLDAIEWVRDKIMEPVINYVMKVS